MKQKTWKFFYISIFWILCLLPVAGMAFWSQDTQSEKRTLAEFPSVKTEEGWNLQWLSEAGDYFQDHFAFRSELVTANALLRGKLLGTSTAASVIQGTDGWLYYTDSLDDYLGQNLLSDRSLFNIAHTMAMVQQRLTSQGVSFTFAVAPNKNTLYPEHMPYYDQITVSEEHNLFRLVSYLEEEGVNYTDLYTRLSEEEDVLYHERDSHWNNRGAAIAADAILDRLGKAHETYEDKSYSVRSDYEGDLDEMLYPQAVTLEKEFYYDQDWTYQYLTETESNFDPKIETAAEGETGSLVMFRDSFTNALLPFLAETYGNAYFSRGVPNQMREVSARNADAVVMERAERFLPEMALNPPVLECPAFQMKGEAAETALDGADHLSLENLGLLTKISGHIRPEHLGVRTRIFAQINAGAYLYEAYPMDIKLEEETSDGGFCLYVSADILTEGENHITLFTLADGGLEKISENTIQEEK